MREALQKDTAVTFTDPRPGLRPRPEGTFLGFAKGDRGLALVQPKYPRGSAPIEVPARSVRALVVVQRRVRAIASIRATQKHLPPKTLVVARLGSLLYAVPQPLGRIEDPEYLAWIRTLPCCGCGASPRSQPHHEGRRPVGRKTHDWLSAPTCWRCHDQFHQHRTLHCCADPTLAKVHVLRTELVLLLEHFAGILGTAAEPFEVRGIIASTLPPEERVPHLRQTLDGLVMELAQRTGRRAA